MQALLQYGFTAFGERVSVAEFVGQLCALLVVFLARRRTMWTWPVQVLATVLLFAVYTSAHLGGLAARQVVIFAISVYGWWAWTRRKDALYGVTVRTGTRMQRLVLVVALVVGTVQPHCCCRHGVRRGRRGRTPGSSSARWWHSPDRGSGWSSSGLSGWRWTRSACRCRSHPACISAPWCMWYSLPWSFTVGWSGNTQPASAASRSRRKLLLDDERLEHQGRIRARS